MSKFVYIVRSNKVKIAYAIHNVIAYLKVILGKEDQKR
uniref:Uncharacterized protein n=1 Tax=Lepeophtheirus salmonis TaxID=72036 RepID=A0A0K2U1Y0_LEPSM